MSITAEAPLTILHRRYVTLLHEECTAPSSLDTFHTPLTHASRQEMTQWPSPHNPFQCVEAPSLPRWERILTNFLDNEEVTSKKKVGVFTVMAQAYNEAIHKPSIPSSPHDAFTRAYGSMLSPRATAPPFINYALSVLTRSVNEEGGMLSDKEEQRLLRFAHVWFYALLQGSSDCILVGFQDTDPWLLWITMAKQIRVPKLWHSLLLQYISYEARFNYSYADFMSKDMHATLAHLRDEEEEKHVSGADSANTFIQATHNFKEFHDEFSCLPHVANFLFTPINEEQTSSPPGGDDE